MKKLIREHYLKQIRPFYDDDIIKILVGIRRCGKSELLNQIKDELLKNKIKQDHIIFIRFELIEFEELTDYKKLNSYVKNLINDKERYYLFLDEVQNVDNFEKVVNSLNVEFNLSIFITGSNSKLLSEELDTVLSGRYVSFHIEPLSYIEIGEYLKQNINNDVFFDNYLLWGSLPKRFDYNEELSLRNYLQSVYDSIILRDVIYRLKLTDRTLFDLILQYAIDTIGREFSFTNLSNFLSSNGRKVSNETIYQYIDSLTKALILKKVYRYDIHGKNALKTLPKYYYTDFGLLQIRNSKSNRTLPYIYENAVLLSLLYKGYEVYSGKTEKGEIDFVAIKNNEPLYIQVSISIKDENTRKRELSAFDEIKDHYRKLIITNDEKDYSENGIKWINIKDFLLKEE